MVFPVAEVEVASEDEEGDGLEGLTVPELRERGLVLGVVPVGTDQGNTAGQKPRGHCGRAHVAAGAKLAARGPRWGRTGARPAGRVAMSCYPPTTLLGGAAAGPLFGLCAWGFATWAVGRVLEANPPLDYLCWPAIGAMASVCVWASLTPSNPPLAQ
jgi:hypothetical protein